jgi:hypothetical protein
MVLGSRAALLLAVLLVLHAAPAVFGDEGMWLFNNPPKKYLEDKYGFKVTDKWLEHVQKSSVRFNSGGSGSFVSPDGLVITNHHVGLDALQKLSNLHKGKDYVKDGFHAKTRDQEFKTEGMELNVLMSMEDVTERVNGAVKGLPPEKAAAARRGAINEIEKEAQKKAGLKAQVVTLYQGGLYHLYLFKKYTDVRLVFAPEQQIGFYGGDPDNFEYPRYDLDICLFRVYENDKPARIEHYLTWSKGGAKDKELVFVSGHPGRTSRLSTVAELEYLRDTGFPFLMQRLNRWEVLLAEFSGRSEENARIAREFLFSVQNSRKARVGGLAGLLDPALIDRKKADEARLQAAWKKSPGEGPSPWERIAAAQKVRKANIRRYTVLEGGSGFNSELFGYARTLLRAAEERAKPNAERLREYGEANLETLKEQLESDERIYDDYEIIKLADGLTFLCAGLGYDDALVQKILAGKSPRVRAVELVKGCKLKDKAERQKLFEGGKDAVEKANDPMIALARLVDPEARAVRKVIETEVEEVGRQAYAEIARAKFALEGTSTYPDATFTLRLAFGVVKGYEEDGKHIPFETDFAGLYERAKEHNDREPFNLPPRWVKHKQDLNLKTPFNFVCTADIIGGNSGSPVINRDAEFVGIIFDGNIQSLVLDFAFTEEQARAVSVCSPAIIEALRKVYDAGALADELTGKKGN